MVEPASTCFHGVPNQGEAAQPSTTWKHLSWRIQIFHHPGSHQLSVDSLLESTRGELVPSSRWMRCQLAISIATERSTEVARCSLCVNEPVEKAGPLAHLKPVLCCFFLATAEFMYFCFPHSEVYIVLYIGS